MPDSRNRNRSYGNLCIQTVKKLSVITYLVRKNGGIASKTVNPTTLSILPAPITESFPVKSKSATDKGNLL